MKKKTKSGKALVIQLDRVELRAALMRLGSAPEILKKDILPVPEDAVEDGILRKPEAVQALLQTLLEQPEYKKVRRVIFSICSTQIISERITVPEVKGRKLSKLLESNMDIYFPVDTREYHLVWQTVGQTEGVDGSRELTLQLWAVPNALLQRYYTLANGCRLSVAAIDFCGSSLAAAVEASYSEPETAHPRKSPLKTQLHLPKRNREKDSMAPSSRTAAAVAEPQTAMQAETCVYLLAEAEHLLLTFVQNGQVQLQRLILRGSNLDNELSDVLMVLEYYNALEVGRDSRTNCVVCGSLANDGAFMSAVRETLTIPVQAMRGHPGPEWCVCQGAARSLLDFGVPEMDHPGGASGQLAQAWQYVLILAGGVLFTGSLLLTFGSRAVWKSTLDGLEGNVRSLQLQAAQNAGNADNYYTYSNLYDNYRSDWDVLFGTEEVPGALRTYNDNLVLALSELETILPTTTSVATIGIADEGLALQFACPDKEEAAYLIMTLRELKYADLNSISDLTVGPGITAQQALPSLAAKTAADAQAAAQAANSEVPPTVGGQYDIGDLIEIMNQASQNSGSADYEDVLAEAIKNGTISKEQLQKSLENLTPEQLDALEAAYGAMPEPAFTVDELLETAEVEQRERALENMLTEDRIAQYRFYLAFKEDINRPAGTEILFNEISEDLWDNLDVFSGLLSGDAETAEGSLPTLIEILTKDEKTLSATEQLIQTNENLAKHYAYYLGVEMKKQEKSDVIPGTIDFDKLLNDYLKGSVAGGSGELNDAISALMPELPALSGTESQDDALQKILEEYLNGNLDVSGNDSALDNILNQIGGDLFGAGIGSPDSSGGNSGTSVPADTRIYFTVTLGYKEDLIKAELERKGLSYNDIVEKLEVGG